MHRVRAAVALVLIATTLAGCSQQRARPTAPSRPPAGPAGSSGAALLESFAGRAVFPSMDAWNIDVSGAPVDAGSAGYIGFLSGRTAQNPGAVRRMHPDFGPPPYGIPYIGVSALTTRVPVTFVDYPEECDAGAPGDPPGYPIPDEAKTTANWIEGGVAGGGSDGDRHLILVDRDRWLLYETWATRWNASAARWEAGSGAVFDLGREPGRPIGWTSADAAGLAIFPGLVRYDEVSSVAEIPHAFRFTARATNGRVWPATHTAGSTSGAPPMGTRLRLKASVVLTRYTPEVQRIFRAMKRYGLVLADNGSDLYVSGTMDARWDNDVLNPAFAAMTADSFEVVQLGWGAPAAGVP
jgi:hypothetical protein